MFAGFTYELATGGLDQLRHPELGANQGLAPLFAEYTRASSSLGLCADAFDFLLHFLYYLVTALGNSQGSCDSRDVGVDVVQRFGRQPQETRTCLHDLGNSFLLVWDSGNN